MDRAQNLVIQLARDAGQLLLDYFHKPDLSINRKSDHSLVTEADVKADQLISTTIKSHFPDDTILSEEIQPQFLNDPRDTVWIVDPLDGTTNFSMGIHYWGVLIAKIESGVPVLAVQFFPAMDELYFARKDGGAYLNDSHIQVEDLQKDQKVTFFSCCSRTFKNYQVSIPYKTRIFGSAAYSMCSVARGIARTAFEARAKIWDIAGAWLLVREAGGVIEQLEGNTPFPLVPGMNYATCNFSIIASASQKYLQLGREQIRPLIKP